MRALIVGACLVLLSLTVCAGCMPKPPQTVAVYPNPTTGPVTFAWAPLEGPVVIEVFAVDGLSVAACGAPGASGRAVWMLTDHQGRRVAPGLYVWVFAAPGVRETGRLVVE